MNDKIDWAPRRSRRCLKTWSLIAFVSLTTLTAIHLYLGLPKVGCALHALGLAAGDCSAMPTALAQSGARLARLYVWVDFVFIAAYVGTLYSVVRWAQESVTLANPDSALLRDGYVALRWGTAVALVACALTDATENTLTLAAIERITSAAGIATLSEWKFRLFAAAATLAVVALCTQVIARTMVFRRDLGS